MPLNVFTPYTLIEAEKLNENFQFLLAGPNDIAVTGSVTIASSALSAGLSTLGWHVCTGTTSNYTVALPAVSGNAGKYLAFRMSPALTKLVTLDGNGSEVIDGSPSRIMWAGETAILYCDGAAWFKVAGKTRPMVGTMRLSDANNPYQAQAAPSTTWITVALNATDTDTTGQMCDNALHRITVLRDGVYWLARQLYFTNAGTASRYAMQIKRNSASYLDSEVTAEPGCFPCTSTAMPLSLGIGQVFNLIAYHTGPSCYLFGFPSAGTCCFLSVAEIPTW